MADVSAKSAFRVNGIRRFEFGISNYSDSISIVFTCCQSESELPVLAENELLALKQVPLASENSLVEAGKLAKALLPNASIHTYNVNQYEYRGLQRAWDVAQSISHNDANSTVVLYFHSKGMVCFVKINLPQIKLTGITYMKCII